MGTVHVLYVQGDYYDVNYLAQTNVISDADVAAQLLTTSDSGEQSISTGGNQAINVATIVDAGSLTTPYVQGQRVQRHHPDPDQHHFNGFTRS